MKIAKWINKNLPIYYPNEGYRTIPAKGWYLAIWNCGHCKYRSNLGKTLRDIRITIRKNGECKFVLKHGAV